MATLTGKLSADDQSRFNKYASNSYLNMARRELEYIRLNPQVQVNLRKEIVRGAVIGGAAGFGIGVTITNIASRCFEALTNPYMFVLKCTVGGGGVGAVWYGRHEIVRINRSTQFLAWKVQAIKDQVYPLFLKFLEDDNEIKGFMCLISGQLIRDPVRIIDNRGHVVHPVRAYEREEIEGWINYRGGQTMCPLRANLITLANLEPDPSYHKNVVARMRAILLMDIDDNVSNGIKAYIEATKFEKDQLATHEIGLLDTALREGRITLDQYRVQHAQVMDKYAL